MVSGASIKKIIFITLTNIGDVALTLPSLDYVKEKFPAALFTVLCGPRATPLFAHDPRVSEVVAYDKHAPFRKKFALFNRLRKERFEVIIDLRDTLFRWLVPAIYKNPRLIRVPRSVRHLRLRHLYKTIAAFGDVRRPEEIRPQRNSLYLDARFEDSADRFLKQYGLSLQSEYIVVVPGSRSHTKRWHTEGFIQVCEHLLKHHSVILLGDANDKPLIQEINQRLENRCIDLAGKLELLEAIAIVLHASLLICNDSAFLHIAGYLNRPIVAIFGPTDEYGSGPYSQNSIVVRKNTVCTPCMTDACKGEWRCMRDISVQTVLDCVNAVLEKRIPAILPYRRILVTRTDRLGDVLLSTPLIKNLRDAIPNVYIAMMVQAPLRQVVEGNPYLDEVIVIDKKGVTKGFINSIRFCLELRRRNFDIALNLHPTVRTHLLVFFAAIPERIGYDRKWGFLNTRQLHHTKQLGLKHESEYVLEFLKELGIQPSTPKMYLPLYPEAEAWADTFIRSRARAGSTLVVVHTQASSPSRHWPIGYFCRLINMMAGRLNVTVIVVGKEREAGIQETESIINMTAQTSLGQLASIIKRSSLLISTDSGPMHMAAALDIPVIAIFGRKQPGLSPRRWGPLGPRNVYLHKDAGCGICLAHDCKNDFACLKAIQPEEVFSCAQKILTDAKK